jgi:hypothetical protein
MRTVPKNNKSVKIKCNHCGFIDVTELRAYQVGDLLRCYTGGGDYGLCRRCLRSNCMVVIEMPAEKLPEAKGWTRVPNT